MNVGRRPFRPGRGVAAIDAALCRVRVVTAWSLLLGGVMGWLGSEKVSLVVGVAAGVLLLAANVVWRWAEGTDEERERRAVAVLVTVDCVVAAAVLLGAGAWSLSGGSWWWVVMAVPVIHGGLRYQLPGVIGTWALGVVTAAAPVIWRWNPRLGLSQLSPLVAPLAVVLAVGVCVAWLAARLVDEIEYQELLQDRTVRRARLLEALTAAAGALASTDRATVATATLEAARGLGCSVAELTPYPDSLNFGEVHGVRVDRVVPGSGLVLCTVHPAPDPDVVQALEALVASAAGGFAVASRYADLEQVPLGWVGYSGAGGLDDEPSAAALKGPQ